MPVPSTYVAIGDVESPDGLSGTKFKRTPAVPWSLIQSVTLTDGHHVRIVLDTVRIDSPPGGRPRPLAYPRPPAKLPCSTALVLRGFAMTLNGDVMTGKELERDVPARLDRLPDGLPFG